MRQAARPFVMRETSVTALRVSLSSQSRPQVLPQGRVGGVHAAALHPARHQGPVRVPDDLVGELARPFGVLPLHLLEAAYRLVRPRAPGVVGDEPAALAAQVVSDDDAHVLELQTLRRVYAAGLVHRRRAKRERLPAIEVPADVLDGNSLALIDEEDVGCDK